MADKKLTEEIQSIVQSQNVTTEQLIQGVDILHRIAPSNMVCCNNPSKWGLQQLFNVLMISLFVVITPQNGVFNNT